MILIRTEYSAWSKKEPTQQTPEKFLEDIVYSSSYDSGGEFERLQSQVRALTQVSAILLEKLIKSKEIGSPTLKKLRAIAGGYDVEEVDVVRKAK